MILITHLDCKNRVKKKTTTENLMQMKMSASHWETWTASQHYTKQCWELCVWWREPTKIQWRNFNLNFKIHWVYILSFFSDVAAVFQIDLSSFLCKIILQSCFILQLFFRSSFIYFCASPYLLVTPLFLPIFLLLIALDLSWSSLSFSCPAKSSVLSVVLTFWI